MLLKPGWIIALMMLWVIIQILITIGDTSLSVSTLDQAPVIQILTTAQKFDSITGLANPANWGNILSNLWKMFTFQAPFLTGNWAFVSVILACVYAGLGLSLLYTFFSSK